MAVVDPSELLSRPLADLLEAAASVRDQAHGRRVTYSPKVFIPLTQLCRDRCGYCTFSQPPARLPAPFLEPEEVLAIARAGQEAGCSEALFTLGEPPRSATRSPPAGWPSGGTTRRWTTWSPCVPWSGTRPACCPTRTPGRSATGTSHGSAR